MPELINDGTVKNLDTYLDFDSEVLRDSIRVLFDNCTSLQERISQLESRLVQLENEA